MTFGDRRRWEKLMRKRAQFSEVNSQGVRTGKPARSWA
jgi:hypothetical protein